MTLTLFPLPPLPPSRGDLTVNSSEADSNATQARYELDRAMLFGGDAEQAQWTRRWGLHALDACADLDVKIGGHNAAMAQLEAELEAGTSVDTSQASEHLDSIHEALTEARLKLERETPDVPAALEALTDAAADLKLASKELDSL